jgi:hypothetical protein
MLAFNASIFSSPSFCCDNCSSYSFVCLYLLVFPIFYFEIFFTHETSAEHHIQHCPYSHTWVLHSWDRAFLPNDGYQVSWRMDDTKSTINIFWVNELYAISQKFIYLPCLITQYILHLCCILGDSQNHRLMDKFSPWKSVLFRLLVKISKMLVTVFISRFNFISFCPWLLFSMSCYFFLFILIVLFKINLSKCFLCLVVNMRIILIFLLKYFFIPICFIMWIVYCHCELILEGLEVVSFVCTIDICVTDTWLHLFAAA